MNFTLKQLETLIWVADLKSFRKAADRLNTTQPNISARIAALEETLGVKLLIRNAAPIRLTARGEDILRHARATLAEAQNLIVAADRSVLHDGILRLGVTELIAHTWLREYLRRLKEAYPKIVVELTVDLSVNLKQALFSRSVDLVFQNGPFQRRTSGSQELGKYHWVWVASPRLGFAQGQRISTSELLSHPILTHARDTKPFQDVADHFASLGKSSPKLVPSSNLTTCLHMAIDAMGVAALPELMVQKELENGELIKLDYDWVPEPLEFLARYDRERSPKFVELAAKLAGDVSGPFTL